MNRPSLRIGFVALLLGVASGAGSAPPARADTGDLAHQIIGVWGVATRAGRPVDPDCKKSTFEYKEGGAFVVHNLEAGKTIEGKYMIVGDKVVMASPGGKTEDAAFRVENGVIHTFDEDGKTEITLSPCPAAVTADDIAKQIVGTWGGESEGAVDNDPLCEKSSYEFKDNGVVVVLNKKSKETFVGKYMIVDYMLIIAGPRKGEVQVSKMHITKVENGVIKGLNETFMKPLDLAMPNVETGKPFTMTRCPPG